mmetsp:Transcript_38159/g.71540  ORF Transcript_38159/g.71540 Transcript_38159/m.71540 type:complete len:1129 (+) Transcript_38159:281-3667(+)
MTDVDASIVSSAKEACPAVSKNEVGRPVAVEEPKAATEGQSCEAEENGVQAKDCTRKDEVGEALGGLDAGNKTSSTDRETHDKESNECGGNHAACDEQTESGRVEREDSVLRQASELRANKAACMAFNVDVNGLPAPSPQPPRLRCHWDYVLLEMNWLAIDFAGERRWRAAAARDAARMAAAAAELPDRGLRPIPAHAAGPDNKTTTDAGSLERSDAQKNPDEAPKCTVSSQSAGKAGADEDERKPSANGASSTPMEVDEVEEPTETKDGSRNDHKNIKDTNETVHLGATSDSNTRSSNDAEDLKTNKDCRNDETQSTTADDTSDKHETVDQKEFKEGVKDLSPGTPPLIEERLQALCYSCTGEWVHRYCVQAQETETERLAAAAQRVRDWEDAHRHTLRDIAQSKFEMQEPVQKSHNLPHGHASLDEGAGLPGANLGSDMADGQMLDPSISPKSKKGKRKKGKKGFMLPGQSSHMHMDANEYRVPGHSGTVPMLRIREPQEPADQPASLDVMDDMDQEGNHSAFPRMSIPNKRLRTSAQLQRGQDPGALRTPGGGSPPGMHGALQGMGHSGMSREEGMMMGGNKKKRPKGFVLPGHEGGMLDARGEKVLPTGGQLATGARSMRSTRPDPRASDRFAPRDHTGKRLPTTQFGDKKMKHFVGKDGKPLVGAGSNTSHLAKQAAQAAQAAAKRTKGGIIQPGMGMKKGDKKVKLKGANMHMMQANLALSPWSKLEEQVLCAIVHEFQALNWALVSDILNGSASLKGIWRRPDACKLHYRQLVERSAESSSPDDPLNIPKGHARILLQRAGLLEEDALQQHQEVLVRVMARHKAQKKDMAEQRRQVVHPSHQQAVAACSAFKSPVEMMTITLEALAAAAEAAAAMAPASAGSGPGGVSGGSFGGGGGAGSEGGGRGSGGARGNASFSHGGAQQASSVGGGGAGGIRSGPHAGMLGMAGGPNMNMPQAYGGMSSNSAHMMGGMNAGGGGMTTPQLGQQSVQRSMAESGQAMMMQRMQQQQQQSNMSPMGHQQMQQGIANQQQQVQRAQQMAQAHHPLPHQQQQQQIARAAAAAKQSQQRQRSGGSLSPAMGGSGGYSAAAGSTVQSQSGVPSGGAPTSPGPGGAFPNMGGQQ